MLNDILKDLCDNTSVLNERLESYRKKLVEDLKETLMLGPAGEIAAYQILKKAENEDEYVLVKYGIDKKGAMAILNMGTDIFFRNINEFNGLDDEVAIKIFEKLGFSSELWKKLDKFSVGNKFLINCFNNYEFDNKKGWNKTKALGRIVDCGYYKEISYDENFISYLKNNKIGDEKMIWCLKKHLLKEKENFDYNDAGYINDLVKALVDSGLGINGREELEMSGWLGRNIMKFPDKSLDYSVFRMLEYKDEYGGDKDGHGGNKNEYGLDVDLYWYTKVDENSFSKFKIYEEHVVSGEKKSHTPGDNYDSKFERLYYKVYESPLIRDKELQRMKEMSFGELLSLFVSEDDSGKKEVKEREIIKMLLFKEIKTGEEIREDDIDKLFKRIDEETANKFVRKLGGVPLK